MTAPAKSNTKRLGNVESDGSRQGHWAITTALVSFCALLLGSLAGKWANLFSPFTLVVMLGGPAGLVGSLFYLLDSILDHARLVMKEDAMGPASLQEKAYVGAKLLIGEMAGIVAVCLWFGLEPDRLTHDGAPAFALALACLAGYSTTFLKTMSSALEKMLAKTLDDNEASDRKSVGPHDKS